MDDKGHVHLADFNIATHLHPNRLLTSNSGTGYYMGNIHNQHDFFVEELKY